MADDHKLNKLIATELLIQLNNEPGSNGEIIEEGEIASDEDEPKTRKDRKSKKTKKKNKSSSKKQATKLKKNGDMTTQEIDIYDEHGSSIYHNTSDQEHGTDKSRSRKKSAKNKSKLRHHRSTSPVRNRNSSDRHYTRQESRRRSTSPSHQRKPYTHHSFRSRSRSPFFDRKHSWYYKDKHRTTKEEDKIDKEKLLKIAKENLVKMIEKGNVPPGTDINKLKIRHLKELTTQKPVRQWTEFCRAISAMEEANYSDLSDDSVYDSDDDTRSVVSSVVFPIKHPFQPKETKEILINVPDFIRLKNRTAEEVKKDIREQFPVSSGSTHRVKEIKWTEVKAMPPPTHPPKKPKKDKKLEPTSSSSTDNIIETTSQQTVQQTERVDIGSAIFQRLTAIRKLQEDPLNVVSLKQLYQSQELMREWTQSKIAPGQFTGESEARLLSPGELEGPIPAWAKKDQLKNAPPIGEGIGLHLLKKMGWNPGEGLGKKSDGVINPIMPVLKFDTKGLVAEDEKAKNLPMQLVSMPEGAEGKNPISSLQEYCVKKKWLVPHYELVEETGPDHKKNFTMKVTVNDVCYQPSISSATKKVAKALCASVCLQAFGLLPKNTEANQETLNAA